MNDPKLADEPGRRAALQRADLLDTPPEAPFDRITKLVCAVLDVPIAIISLIDADRQWLKSAAGIERGQCPREDSFCNHTIKARAPLVIEDAGRDPRFIDNPFVTQAPHIASYLGVPLGSPDGYNLGALCAIDSKPRAFSEAQIEIMKSFAGLVTEEIELRRLAQTDQLTGALSRRGFCLELERAISRFVRHQQPSALLLFDIDHFKRVNDGHGHPAGDQVLRAVGQRMAEMLRSSDVIGRLGGEEFGLLLADADQAEALGAAERFRAAIQALRVGQAPVLRVTASFGVAVLAPDLLATDTWLAKADAGLYAAKRGGRNRCCLAPARHQVPA